MKHKSLVLMFLCGLLTISSGLEAVHGGGGRHGGGHRSGHRSGRRGGWRGKGYRRGGYRYGRGNWVGAYGLGYYGRRDWGWYRRRYGWVPDWTSGLAVAWGVSALYQQRRLDAVIARLNVRLAALEERLDRLDATGDADTQAEIKRLNDEVDKVHYYIADAQRQKAEASGAMD